MRQQGDAATIEKWGQKGEGEIARFSLRYHAILASKALCCSLGGRPIKVSGG
jgi:hypothetical protein